MCGGFRSPALASIEDLGGTSSYIALIGRVRSVRLFPNDRLPFLPSGLRLPLRPEGDAELLRRLGSSFVERAVPGARSGELDRAGCMAGLGGADAISIAPSLGSGIRLYAEGFRPLMPAPSRCCSETSIAVD